MEDAIGVDVMDTGDQNFKILDGLLAFFIELGPVLVCPL